MRDNTNNKEILIKVDSSALRHAQVQVQAVCVCVACLCRTRCPQFLTGPACMLVSTDTSTGTTSIINARGFNGGVGGTPRRLGQPWRPGRRASSGVDQKCT